MYRAYTLNGAGLEQSRVLTVDIQDLKATAAAHPLWKKYVTSFKGSSTDAAIVGEIAGLVRGRKTYSPMASRGSYPGGGGHAPGRCGDGARFRARADGGGKEYTQDFSREVMVTTFNPGGWLRRK